MDDREERRRQREAQAQLEAIADEVAAELGDWDEVPQREPGQVVDLGARREGREDSRAAGEGMIGADMKGGEHGRK